MSITNPTDFLVEATGLPAAIEAKLPSGAPKLSVTLTDIANKLPKLPNFPTALPDLPALPTMPAAPAAATSRYVTGVTVTPVAAAIPKAAVLPTREKIPLVYE